MIAELPGPAEYWRSIADAQFSLTFPNAHRILDQQRLRPHYAWVAFWYVGVIAFLWINLKLPPFLQVADERDAAVDQKNSH